MRCSARSSESCRGRSRARGSPRRPRGSSWCRWAERRRPETRPEVARRRGGPRARRSPEREERPVARGRRGRPDGVRARASRATVLARGRKSVRPLQSGAARQSAAHARVPRPGAPPAAGANLELPMPDAAEVVRREVVIAATPETVFSFLTDATKMIRWAGIEAESDPRPGGVHRTIINPGHVISGEYLEVEPPAHIVCTWGWADSPRMPPGSTTVEIILSP